MRQRKQDHLYITGVVSTRVIALFLFSRIIPCLVASLPIFLGYKLLLPKAAGQASLIVNSSLLSAHLLNAAPGIFLAVGGIVALIMYISKGVSVHVNQSEPSHEKS